MGMQDKKINNYTEAVFREDREKIPVFELVGFLHVLRIFYFAAFEEFGEEIEREEKEGDPKRIVDVAKNIANKLLKTIKEDYHYHYLLCRHLCRHFCYYFYKYPPYLPYPSSKEIFIAKIRRKSPLTIWFIGISTAIVAAFIITGGEIEISAVPPKFVSKCLPLQKD